MKPAMSIVLFTTVAGAAQGLAVVLAIATLAGTVPAGSASGMLWIVAAMLVIALAASFFHLGHPMRAWRAALMWRTSWMSREVIVLPVFIGVIVAWALRMRSGEAWLPWVSIAGAFVLWYCTAMIYACIRFIQEWAHPLTIVNYVMLGLSSGLTFAGALSVIDGDAGFAGALAPWAIAVTALAWVARALSLRRNASLKPKSTTQSATGIRSARVVQTAMGMTGGSFNTREFFHGASQVFLRNARIGFQVLAFALPLALFVIAMGTEWTSAWLLAAPLQFIGLLIERWFFFAQAKHPQNLYYQQVS